MALESFVDGLHCKYENNGKQPLILIHGLAMDKDSWHYQYEFFKHDYNLISYDLRGHGRSLPKQSYTLDDFVNDLKKIKNYFCVENEIVMGFSLGGTIALKYAEQNNIKKLVTINSPYHPLMIKPSFLLKYVVARNVPKTFISAELDNEPVWKYKNRLNTHRKCFVNANIKEIDKIIWTMIRNVPKVNLPDCDKLMIYSQNDEIVKPPKDEHVLIKGGHHYVIAQKYEEVNKIIKKFL
ncbi:alpha/beta hydrolase [Candidatus Woesearchaeota archaeon]|nr:MAG: alpha/beta hydrolase [Candidatus Woesearchaeota archaeon]